MIPEICRGKESNLIDPEEVQHYLRGFQKDHQVIQPVKNRQKKLYFLQPSHQQQC